MRTQSAATTDQASTIVPSVSCNHPDDVAEVRAEAGYRLFVRFFDGTSGIVDMSALVLSPQAGVFSALRDPDLFAEAFVALGAVTWPGGQDLAPDAMHKALGNRGVWTLS